MVAVNEASQLPVFTHEQAELWIAAHLAEASALRLYDDQTFPVNDDPATVTAAEQLHAAWRRWADAADGLLDRIRPLRKRGRYLNGVADLENGIGRTRARLSCPPVPIDRNEKLIPHEEVVREFRDRVARQRTAGV